MKTCGSHSSQIATSRLSLSAENAPFIGFEGDLKEGSKCHLCDNPLPKILVIRANYLTQVKAS